MMQQTRARLGLLTLTPLVFGAVLQACALAWPFEISHANLLSKGQPSALLQILGMSLWAWFLHKCQRPLQAFIAGWAFASVWLCAVFWWLYVSMHDVGGMPSVLAALAVVLLAAALGLYYGIMSALCNSLRTRGLLWALSFACTWTLAELMRGQWLTGFPWGAIGYAHADGWLRAWAPLVGVYGLGWVAAFVSALIVVMLCRWTSMRGPKVSVKSAMIYALACVAALMPFFVQLGADQPMEWGQANGSFKAKLLQANVNQAEKFEPENGVRDALNWYSQQARASDADLVLAPETAIPLFEQELPQTYLTSMMSEQSKVRAIMLGIPTRTAEAGYANSVIALERVSSGSIKKGYLYSKHHLVPFGEFVPPLFRWFTELMKIPLGDFSRGATNQKPYAFMGQRLAPNICYEDLFGEEWAIQFRDSANAPTVMLNFSNIAWFGKTIAVEQHLQISRMRALEFQRPVLRATNSGATALIDERAQVLALLAPHQRGTLEVNVTGRAGATTPYARWAGQFGLWPIWIACLLLLGVTLVTNRTNSARMGLANRA